MSTVDVTDGGAGGDVGRLGWVIGLVATAVVATIVAAVVLAPRLPAAVPSHWSGAGESDGAMGLIAFTAIMVVTEVGVAALFLAMVRRTSPAAMQRVVAGAAVAMPVWLAGIHLATLTATLDRRGPIPFPVGGLLVAVVAAVAAGALAAALLEPDPRRIPELAVTTATVAEGEAVVWSGRVDAPVWLYVGLAVAGVIDLVLLVTGLWPLSLVVLVVVGASATLLRVAVTVGPGGLVVRSGPFGVLRSRTPLADISDVDAVDVDPLAFGGWGMRVLPGVRAIVLRRGPGLRVVRRDAPTLVVTIDDAVGAAGVLRAHLAVHRSSS